MGKQIREVIFDSLTNEEIGEEHYEEVNLVVNDVRFVLYLSDKSKKKFDEDVTKWTKNEEPQKFPMNRLNNNPPKNTRSGNTSSMSKDELAAVRVWASENGFKVSDRGRIAADVIKAYEQAS